MGSLARVPDEARIGFEEMAPEEARRFLGDAFEYLVADLADTNEWPDDVAREQARTMEQGLLPEHELTEHHAFLWTVIDGRRAGRIWLGPMPDGRPLMYIWDVIIDGSERGSGLGTAAIDEVVRKAGDAGLDGVALTVWDTNPDARRLYERLRFTVESHNDGRSLMVRKL